MGLDLHCRHGAGLGGPVQLRVLQPDADITLTWPDYDGSLETEKLVYFLSDGNDDPGDLQAGEQRGDAGQLNDELHALRTGHRNQ